MSSCIPLAGIVHILTKAKASAVLRNQVNTSWFFQARHKVKLQRRRHIIMKMSSPTAQDTDASQTADCGACGHGSALSPRISRESLIRRNLSVEVNIFTVERTQFRIICGN